MFIRKTRSTFQKRKPGPRLHNMMQDRIRRSIELCARSAAPCIQSGCMCPTAAFSHKVASKCYQYYWQVKITSCFGHPHCNKVYTPAQQRTQSTRHSAYREEDDRKRAAPTHTADMQLVLQPSFQQAPWQLVRNDDTKACQQRQGQALHHLGWRISPWEA